MRVIAGKFRGAVLGAPPGRVTRPITDQVKESLFNILGHRLGTLGSLPEFPVLDLFCGTGGLGIESLSRGAASCLFVEHDRLALRCLRDNLRKLRLLGAPARIAGENAWTMRILPAERGGYGLIFVDPPYRAAGDLRRLSDLLERLGGGLAPGGLIVLRMSTRAARVHDLPPSLVCVDEREFGRMRVQLFSADQRADRKGPEGA
jgi:16S rRNA (guanine966-N2)-methyltransferase